MSSVHAQQHVASEQRTRWLGLRWFLRLLTALYPQPAASLPLQEALVAKPLDATQDIVPLPTKAMAARTPEQAARSAMYARIAHGNLMIETELGAQKCRL